MQSGQESPAPEILTAIDHIGIATASIDAALPLYTSVFGLQVTLREMIEEQGTEVALLRCGDQAVELLAPLRDDSAVATFLAERGPGMHHVAYRVADIQAALVHLAQAGLQLVDAYPRRGAGGALVAFVHPRSTGRVLIELVARSVPDGAP